MNIKEQFIFVSQETADKNMFWLWHLKLSKLTKFTKSLGTW